MILEGQIVVRLDDDAQIGHRIADFLALVEARTANHPVGHPQRDEAFLELSRLKPARTSTAIWLSDTLAR